MYDFLQPFQFYCFFCGTFMVDNLQAACLRFLAICMNEVLIFQYYNFVLIYAIMQLGSSGTQQRYFQIGRFGCNISCSCSQALVEIQTSSKTGSTSRKGFLMKCRSLHSDHLIQNFHKTKPPKRPAPLTSFLTTK